ncbi:unnamed protein product [Amoebophrya sp. A25]|nr:unnamed protein product [Amoebophrya sp. A25]|eukprot:GSA25T00025131001.1
MSFFDFNSLEGANFVKFDDAAPQTKKENDRETAEVEYEEVEVSQTAHRKTTAVSSGGVVGPQLPAIVPGNSIGAGQMFVSDSDGSDDSDMSDDDDSDGGSSDDGDMAGRAPGGSRMGGESSMILGSPAASSQRDMNSLQPIETASFFASFERVSAVSRQYAEEQWQALTAIRETSRRFSASALSSLVGDVLRASESTTDQGKTGQAVGGSSSGGVSLPSRILRMNGDNVVESANEARVIWDLLSGASSRKLLSSLRQDPTRRNQRAIRAAMCVYTEHCDLTEKELALFLSEEVASLLMLQDERTNMRNSEADATLMRSQLEGLFQPALRAVLSFAPSLWIRYATAVRELVGGASDIYTSDTPQAKEACKQVERVFEHALGVLALDPDLGAQIFSAYRTEFAAERDKVEKLWKRQLQIPSPHLAAVLAEYGRWLEAAALPPAQIEERKAAARSLSQKAENTWGSRKRVFDELVRMENGLREADTRNALGLPAAASSSSDILVNKEGSKKTRPPLDVARELLAIERKTKDVQRLEWAYLRCCESVAASGHRGPACTLFAEYADFVQKKMGDRKRAAAILERAIKVRGTSGLRYCPLTGVRLSSESSSAKEYEALWDRWTPLLEQISTDGGTACEHDSTPLRSIYERCLRDSVERISLLNDAPQLSSEDDEEAASEKKLLAVKHQLARFVSALKAYGDVTRRLLGQPEQMRTLYRRFLEPAGAEGTVSSSSVTTTKPQLSEELQEQLSGAISWCLNDVRAHWMRVEAFNYANTEILVSDVLGLQQVKTGDDAMDLHTASTAFRCLRYCFSDGNRDIVLAAMQRLVRSVSDRPDEVAFELVDMLRNDPRAADEDLANAKELYQDVCRKHNEEIQAKIEAIGGEEEMGGEAGPQDELWPDSPDDPFTPFGVEGMRLLHETSGTGRDMGTFVTETFREKVKELAKQPDMLPVVYLAWLKAECYGLALLTTALASRAKEMFKACASIRRSDHWWWSVLGLIRHSVRNRGADYTAFVDLYKFALQETRSAKLSQDFLDFQREVGSAADILQATSLHMQAVAREAEEAAARERKQAQQQNARQPAKRARVDDQHYAEPASSSSSSVVQRLPDHAVDDVESNGEPKATKRARTSAPETGENSAVVALFGNGEDAMDADVGEDAMEVEDAAVRMPRGFHGKGRGKQGKKGQREKKPKPESGAHYLQVTLGADAAARFVEADRTVFVRNIDVLVDEAELDAVISQQEIVGLEQIRVVRHFNGNPKGMAYLDFDSPENVRKCCEKLNGLELRSRKLFAAPSKPTQALYEPRKVFISGVEAGFDVRSWLAANLNSTPFVEIVDVRLLAPKEGEEKGGAFVEFSEDSAVDTALALNENLPPQIEKIKRSIPMKSHELKYAPLRVNAPGTLADQMKWKRGQDKLKSRVKFTLFVKNLNKKTTEAALQQHFSQFGAVNQVALMRNEKGKSKCFAYVEFADEEAATAAVTASTAGNMLDGRTIQVSRSDRPITTAKTAGSGSASSTSSAAPGPLATSSSFGATAGAAVASSSAEGAESNTGAGTENRPLGGDVEMSSGTTLLGDGNTATSSNSKGASNGKLGKDGNTRNMRSNKGDKSNGSHWNKGKKPSKSGGKSDKGGYSKASNGKDGKNAKVGGKKNSQMKGSGKKGKANFVSEAMGLQELTNSDQMEVDQHQEGAATSNQPMSNADFRKFLS